MRRWAPCSETSGKVSWARGASTSGGSARTSARRFPATRSAPRPSRGSSATRTRTAKPSTSCGVTRWAAATWASATTARSSRTRARREPPRVTARPAATTSGWAGGGAGNWSIGSDDLLVLGRQIVGNHEESTVGANPKQEANETFYTNAFMGIETHVNSWLTLRFGAQNAVLYSLKNE